MKSKLYLLLIFLFFDFIPLYAQDSIVANQSIFYPLPAKKWQSSIGLTFTTMPYDITEEQHFRAPAIDYHFIKKLSERFYLDGRINAQIVQNQITIGPRWAKKLSDKVAISLGNDVGLWFGYLKLQGLNTRGFGFQNFPNASVGFTFRKNILVTLRFEEIMTLGVKTHTGEIDVESDYKLFSGSAYSLVLEQPFYGKRHISLGFRAIYSSFFWQTWSFFETFDRNIFYPQIIVGLML